MAKGAHRAPEDDASAAVASSAFRRQVRFWLASAIILAIFLYVFSSILLPFVAGMVLAYFLDPVADRIGKNDEVALLCEWVAQERPHRRHSGRVDLGGLVQRPLLPGQRPGRDL